MKVKTSDLKGPALDYAVAVCEGMEHLTSPKLVMHWRDSWHPSSNWTQAGPIIEREDIELSPNDSRGWRSQTWGPYAQAAGDAPLKAAMRCYVASKMGDEVEIPEELLK